MRERAGFMAAHEQIVDVTHPYAEFSAVHRGLAPTPLRMPAYSAPCVPFRWMRENEAAELAEEHGVDYDAELEERAREDYKVPAGWVQHGENQRALLNGFFRPIAEEESLCFFYAKRVPLTEIDRRVIVGVGRVARVADAVPYRNNASSPITPYVWEKVVEHSIRPSFEDGFVLPYQEVLAAGEQDAELDMDELVAFAPDEHWLAFSYGSEHVSHDAAIGGLVSCARVLERIEQRIDGHRARELRWISERLGDLWRLRGPAPGLGAALQAFGLERGVLLIHELAPILKENEDPWPLIERVFDDPHDVRPGLQRLVTSTWRRKWKSLDDERRQLLRLLARFDLTVDQAKRFWDPDTRDADLSDATIIANPYLLYEHDRFERDAIALSTVDHGAFPSPVVAAQHPLPAPTAMDDELDPRRVRAVTVAALEDAAGEGNTVAPRADVVRRVTEMELEPSCPVDADLYKALLDDLAPTIDGLELGDGRPAFQLDRLRKVGELITHRVRRRLKGAPHQLDVDWRARVDAALGDSGDDPDEELARQEKATALETLARDRFSVLVGPAGTGKTTLLQLLCAEPEIRDRGVLLLAPTGKARVQLSRRIEGAIAKTVAQFLHPNRYDGETGRYLCTGGEKEDAYATVVVDESSMLTEEMLAAILDALGGVHRLILAGDPRQLPPVGPGRPFVDIVRYLEPANVELTFPRCGAHYAELTVPRRQTSGGAAAGERSDLALAEWFAGRRPGAGGDEVWELLRRGNGDGTLRVVNWTDAADLQHKLQRVLAEELPKMGDVDDVKGFEESLGGTEFKERIYFRLDEDGDSGSGRHADDWQILTPVRNHGYGVRELNRFIQLTYRQGRREDAEAPYRRVPKPMGDEGLVYGDKVMSVVNETRWTRPKGLENNYVANGEIGIAVGQYLRENRPKELQVEYSSQPGRAYRYWHGDFGEGGAPLELAYAITIHKSQGSEFGVSFLVIPERTRLLSRELLYTALTRQRDRVVLLLQGNAELFDLTHGGQSEIARRLTTLFGLPRQVEVGGAFLEEGLIHRTRRGDLVRSKSEVIIADLLFDRDLEYSYEPEFVGNDGKIRRPDFRVEDPETGTVVFWEHLGMLHQDAYRRRWQRKLAWYRAQGVLPHDEGGGPSGTLVTTEDDEHGGIDSARLAALVADLFGV